MNNSKYPLSLQICKEHKDKPEFFVYIYKEGKKVPFNDLDKSEQGWVMDSLFSCFNFFSQEVSKYW